MASSSLDLFREYYEDLASVPDSTVNNKLKMAADFWGVNTWGCYYQQAIVHTAAHFVYLERMRAAMSGGGAGPYLTGFLTSIKSRNLSVSASNNTGDGSMWAQFFGRTDAGQNLLALMLLVPTTPLVANGRLAGQIVRRVCGVSS